MPVGLEGRARQPRLGPGLGRCGGRGGAGAGFAGHLLRLPGRGGGGAAGAGAAARPRAGAVAGLLLVLQSVLLGAGGRPPQPVQAVAVLRR